MGGAHGVPVGHGLGCDAIGHLGDADPVGEGVADRGVLLAALGELGPVRGDGLVVGDDAALDEHVDGGGGHALGAGEGGEERAPVDGAGGLNIGEAGPGVDDELAVVVGGDLEPHLDAAGDELFESPP